MNRDERIDMVETLLVWEARRDRSATLHWRIASTIDAGK
jgi:hypothetical protein